ncbi:AAA family ATPase [Fodinisporobacter ferrooxydans]|uniref:AAA family ATPase n=1 Tax=Fodinisporobacter ferrooxydans TaxID=2901836 RepID=A0ABY4CLB8_9BACL|nr:AAA family ATPase [Alicyclobacillaceae bacterium MYW30-H2]
MSLQWIAHLDDAQTEAAIQQMARKRGREFRIVSDYEELKGKMERIERGIVFLAGSQERIYDQCRELTLQYPDVVVILLVSAADLNIKRSMHAGALDVLTIPLRQEELEQAIKEAEKRLSQKLSGMQRGELPQKKQGRVLAVCGTKGGIGKTTISVNTAAAVAKYGSSVAILDLDLQFGDVADFFDMVAKRTIYDWVKEGLPDPQGTIGKFLLPHESGVHILAAPQRPEFAEVITGEHVSTALATLKDTHDVVLIDLPSALLETGLAALDEADEILLVTSMELPTLKNTKRFLETVESLGLKERVKVILNRDSEVTEIRLDTVETILAMSVYARIPSEGKIVVPSVNRGIPFVLSSPRANVSRSIYTLAARLYKRERSNLKAKKKSLLQRMFGR